MLGGLAKLVCLIREDAGGWMDAGGHFLALSVSGVAAAAPPMLKLAIKSPSSV